MVPWAIVGATMALCFLMSQEPCRERFGKYFVDHEGPLPLAIKDCVDELVGKDVAMIGWCCTALAGVLYLAYDIFTATVVMPALPQPPVSKSNTLTP